MFLWRVFNDCVSSMGNLIKKGIPANPNCLVWRKHIETTYRTLFECKRADDVCNNLLPQDVLQCDFNNSIQERMLYLVETSLIRISIWLKLVFRQSGTTKMQLECKDKFKTLRLKAIGSLPM